mgnify:CR=1 FL=1
MNIFDIIGPVMVGPSSSHTAGAVRIGYISGKLLGEPVKKAAILLYGSFLATGKGTRHTESLSGRTSWHGTGRYTDSGQLKNCSTKRN